MAEPKIGYGKGKYWRDKIASAIYVNGYVRQKADITRVDIEARAISVLLCLIYKNGTETYD